MRHTITFGAGNNKKNTWTDWGLLPVKQPVIAPPPVKTNCVELPGRSGEIDLSETVTGYPLYGNRTGQLSFLKVARWQDYQTVKNEILDFLHGQRTQLVLSDDLAWYYEGRISVEELACDEKHGTIVLAYNLDPFKWFLSESTEPWKWDPFSFEDGVIYDGVYADSSQTPAVVYSNAGLISSLSIGHTEVSLSFPAQATGSAPLSVQFKATQEPVTVYAKRGTSELSRLNVTTGAFSAMPGLVMWRGKWLYSGQECNVTVVETSPSATVNTGLQMLFRPGRL